MSSELRVLSYEFKVQSLKFKGIQRLNLYFYAMLYTVCSLRI
jgi:hypothetical protein